MPHDCTPDPAITYCRQPITEREFRGFIYRLTAAVMVVVAVLLVWAGLLA